MKLSVLLAIVFCLAMMGTTGAGAQSAGDTCATAGVITTNGFYPFDTTGASGDDPCVIFPLDIPTVWYRFTAPGDGRVNADLCGSSFDTYLTVFSGDSCPASCSGILVENNDSCGIQSAVSFAVTAGQIAYFAVSGSREADFGPGVFDFEFVPAGDTCDDAIEVASGSATPFDLTLMSAGDDPCDGPTFRTLWFRYTASANGVVTASTCGSSFNTNLQGFIAEGCPVTCGDKVLGNNASCGFQSLVSFDLRQGETAYFVVGGWSTTDAGPGVFNLAFAPTQAGLECGTAGVVTGNGTYAFDITGVPDRDPCFSPALAVWYRYTAPDNGMLNVDLCGSTFNTWLSLFNTDACPVSCGNRIATNDNSCGLQSSLEIEVVAGQSFYICVAGSGSSDFGPGVMNFSFTPGGPVVAGDINGDGVVNVADVTEFGNLLRAGTPPPLVVGDIDNDGVVNDFDMSALASMIVND